MNDLQFDFAVDKTTNSVSVNKAFAAALPLVWDAFTKKELLDQWWAPKPWVSRTKSMDFKVGGQRFYAMVSPDGQEHWSIEQYAAISPKTNVKWISSFASKDGKMNTAFPSSAWDLHFIEENGITKVSIVIKHKTLIDLETQLQMGFRECFTMTLNELDTLLLTIIK